jgi:hypothetical protein
MQCLTRALSYGYVKGRARPIPLDLSQFLYDICSEAHGANYGLNAR